MASEVTLDSADKAPTKVVVQDKDNFQKVPNYEAMASKFFRFNATQPDVFRPETLRNARGQTGAVFGGLIFAQALAAAENTVEPSFQPHSVHSYFILNVDKEQPIEYKVRRIRDGRSFCTRTVDAIQNDKTAFILQASFCLDEQSSIKHQSEMPDVPAPHELLSMRDAVPMVKEKIAKGEVTLSASLQFRIDRHDTAVYSSDTDLFEMRSTNLGNYYGYNSDGKRVLFFWMRARGDLPVEDHRLHRWLVSYNTDAVMALTAVTPHYAVNQFTTSMMFSLDHSVWFHQRQIRADDWLLFETRSHYAGGGRSLVEGRIWQPDGTLVLSCQQEVLIRTRGSPSQL